MEEPAPKRDHGEYNGYDQASYSSTPPAVAAAGAGAGHGPKQMRILYQYDAQSVREGPRRAGAATAGRACKGARGPSCPSGRATLSQSCNSTATGG